MNELTRDRRAGRVAAAVTQWVDALIDLGGRNNLLYYRDLKVGTLDLAGADPGALTQLHAGRPVRLSRLFTPDQDRIQPIKNARKIRDKIQELDEERGIRAGYFAIGMATWTDPEGRRTPNAPVLLRQVKLDPVGGAQDDFDIELADEIELNPVLSHLLDTQFAVRFNPEELVALVDLNVGPDPQPVYAALCKRAADVPGFAINHREVIGTFTYAKLPMVVDLQVSAELLADNEVVAAIAGDADAARAVRGSMGESDATELDGVSPSDEFLVLDADSSQSRAINTVVAGSHLVVKGPPGTGKSQTIVNLISTLVARGQKVLFVAEKRAAIDAVLRRLEHVGLHELVMDLHEGAGHRRVVAESLARSLDEAARVRPPDQARLHQRLTRTRSQLSAHTARMHHPRHPWGISVYEAQAAALATPAGLAATTRFHGPTLRGLSGEVVNQARRALREYAQIGGLQPAIGASPWAGAPISTPEQAQEALETANQIVAESLPMARDRLTAVLTETGLRPPTTLAEWHHAFALLDRVAITLSRFSHEAYTADLPTLCAATGNGAYRRQRNRPLGLVERFRLVKYARALWRPRDKPSKHQLHQALCAAADEAAQWAQHATDGRPPRMPADLLGAENGYAVLTQDLQALAAHLATAELLQLDPVAIGQRVHDLTADVASLYKMPRLNQLSAWLTGHGLDQLLEEARSRGLDADQIVALFDDTWHRSLLDHIGVSEPAYGAFSGDGQDDLVKEFGNADTAHLTSTPQRVKRVAGEALIAALNTHDDQARLIRAEAGKRTRHKPLRELWRLAPEVLLAVKPCWAMSPLVVSQVLPARQLFDVVRTRA